MLRIAIITCFITICSLITVHSFPYDQPVKFDYLTVRQGLSDLTIRSIIQDHTGYMWFGTNNGLNRYDGKEIIQYYNDRYSKSGLKANIIYCLYEDSRRNLWIGTWGGGLSLYNPDQDNFKTFMHEPQDPGSIRHNDVWSIFEDSKGNLWIATQKGLERFDYDTQTFEKHLSDLTIGDESGNLKRKAFSCITEKKDDGTLWISIWKHGLLNYDPINKKLLHHFVHQPGNTKSLNTSEINTLFADDDGSLWIGPYKGDLERMWMVDGVPVFKRYPMASSARGLSDNRINFILKDHKGLMWIGTEVGINILNKATGHIEQYFHNAEIENSLSSNHLWSGYYSSNGIIWIGSLEGGVNIYDPWKRKFVSDYPLINQAKEQHKKFVKSIFKDSNGCLWVGTDYGLNQFSPEGDLLQTYTHGKYRESLDIGGVSGIVEDNKGTLWVATWGGGLHTLDKKTKTIKRYQHLNNKEFPRGIGDLNIQSMTRDLKGNILIGTSFGHFYHFNPNTNSFHHFLCQDIDNLRGAPVIAISPENDGSVWLGLSENGGVMHLNLQSGEFTRYYQKANDEYSLSSNDIFSLYNDKEYLWIGTKNGLNLLEKSTGKITVFDERHNLQHKSVLSIQKDIEGNIWFSTIQGISKLDRQTDKIFNYDNKDGALGNCIVSWKGANSEIYFGGINGIFSFNPLSIHNNTYVPPVVFTALKIFNQPVYPDKDNSPLKKHINQTSRVTLDYHQTSFSFEFSSLNYTLPEKNQYRYMLEGFDQDWVYAGNRNVAYYTNVGQGSYVFKVQGSNNDGLWNEQVRAIEIIILPPWWNSFWFRFLVLLIMMAVIASWIVIRTYRLRQQQKLLQKLVDERTKEIEAQKIVLKLQAEKLHKADQLKINFFTNISHEFRTPLTLILNPLDELLKELSHLEKYKKTFSVVKRNTHRLISLINQFLDISKIEAGVLQLHVSKGDIIEYIIGIIDAYEFAARQKNINLNVNLATEAFICYFDGDKVEKILYNLISNALKYTPSGKNIDIEVNFTTILAAQDHPWVKSDNSNHVIIRVKDQGTGIPEEKLERIFERFYQIEKQPSGGTGIGLSLTKDLVDIYRGKITVNSTLNVGTDFTVVLPIEKGLFRNNEFVNSNLINDEVKTEKIAFDEGSISSELSDLETNDDFLPDNNKNTILIVDDNYDVRQYLSEVFEKNFNVLLAHNGQEGLKKALKYLPQIIVSDIMMPVMDGFDLCEKVKTDYHTCHIPVILLTAKASDDDKVLGIETGADAYILKPFDINLLQVTVAKLLESREKLKQVFRRELILRSKDVTIVSSDEKLLNKIMKILDENLYDSEFGVEQLSKEVGLSRTHLYRKIKELTNLTAIEFIRNARLKRAAKLLSENKHYVSEVAYICGFNELSYFRKIFKEFYGISPQKYSASPSVTDQKDDTEIIDLGRDNIGK
jgi:signal transduction histidine kinase/ligand-binding sensor domain-containing protein/DNA-binding response OmpR family regulator